jgi:hypothetical protein
MGPSPFDSLLELMKYMFLYREKAGPTGQASTGAYGDVRASPAHRGRQVLGGAPLHPLPPATTVSVHDGKRVVTDGPFMAREQLGGCR